MLSANGLNVYILYFNMAVTQKFSCRNLVGPSLSRSTLFCFGLAWSVGRMYPEMDIHRTGNWTVWSTIQGVTAQAVSKSDEREARGRFEITSTITP